MNKEDLILHKLESMETNIKDVRSEMKDARSEMNNRIDKIEFKLEVVNSDVAEMKVNQAKHTGDLHTLEVKIDGKLETLETKLDGLIENTRERNLDTNERWKIGGIIVSCGVAVVSLILSILTRMGQ